MKEAESGDLIEPDEERKVLIIQERKRMIGWGHKTDRKEKNMTE